MKIYTKTGDAGKTSLLGGKRVEKYDLRIESYGTVDELNSHVGLLICFTEDDRSPLLKKVQNNLFNIGSVLASQNPAEFGLVGVTEDQILILEQDIDIMNEDLSELKNFILPGGNQAAAQAHICRCVCRRAERRVVALATEENIQPELVKYLNRLSDWFFVYSRFILHRNNIPHVIWTNA